MAQLFRTNDNAIPDLRKQSIKFGTKTASDYGQADDARRLDE
jgi:hypothetical protein